MFAGLALEGSADEDSDEGEETMPVPKPASKPTMPRGPALPEADDDDDDLLDDADLASAAAAPPLGASMLGGIDPDDLAITIETLEAISKDMTLFRSRPLKGLREAIGPLAKALTGDGSGAGGGRRQRHGSRLGGLDPKERLKQMDRDALNHRVLRAERLARLEELQERREGDDEDAVTAGRLLMGGDDPNASLNAAQGASLVPFQAGKIVAGAIPDGPALASATRDGSGVETAALEAAGPARLHLARSCYICKRPYRDLHAFYAQLCTPCAELNWRKRSETCNLFGRVALVTGGRVKIGFRIVLKLLRCGCEVIASTRFPVDAVRRFAAEEDHESWQHRLHVIGADLRDLKGLEVT